MLILRQRWTWIKSIVFIAVMNEKDFRGVDLNLLVAFHVLVRERNVTRAAEKLRLGQPAASAALRRLRRLFGDPLLVRVGQGMAPTPRALALAEETRPIMARLSAVVRAPAAFDPASTAREFTLGMPDNLELFLMPALLARAEREAPGARFVVRPTDLHRGSAMLEDGSMELGLSTFGPVPSWARKDELAVVGFACLYDGARLGVGAPISLEDYLALPHILVSFDGERRGDVDDALSRLGRTRTVVMATRTFSALPFLLKRTRAVATLPDPAARAMAADTGLTVAPPPLPVDPFTESLIWHARHDADPAHRWLRTVVRATFLDCLAPAARA